MAIKFKSPSLFWRTFWLLILLLLTTSLAWLQSFRVLSEVPFSRGISQHIVSTANLTRYALISADENFRPDLLLTLAYNEGVRIIPKEDDDTYEPLTASGDILQLVTTETQHFLGSDTILAESVNGEIGLWVSLAIEGDLYWLKIREDLLDPPYGSNWLWWAMVAILASIVGATLLTQRTVMPMARLSAAAKQLGRGEEPAPLPEDEHTAEIDALNRSFNGMVRELKRMAEDRELLLAGVSHDLRTPLTRLRLEIEMAMLSDDTRDAMVSDLEQMEGIVNQFLVYAKKNDQPLEKVDLGLCVNDTISDMRIRSKTDIVVETSIMGNLFVMAQPMELTRAVQNLIVNADRYGRDSETHRLDLTIQVFNQGNQAVLRVSDRGQGVPADQMERITRPFERGDKSRGGAKGAGLGLAIVKRVVERSGGSLNLLANHPKGLICELVLPIVNERGEKPTIGDQTKPVDAIIREEDMLL